MVWETFYIHGASTDAPFPIPLAVYLAVWHEGWVGGVRLEPGTLARLFINYMTLVADTLGLQAI